MYEVCLLSSIVCYHTLNSLSLFWLAESVQWIFEISACDIITADYTIKVTGNHVVYDCGAWFLRVIISSLLALFWLPSVKKHKHEFFCFVQCITKQLLDLVFVVSRIIKVSVRIISLSLWLRLITPTSTLIILDITKTSSNNCLLFVLEIQKLTIWDQSETITLVSTELHVSHHFGSSSPKPLLSNLKQNLQAYLSNQNQLAQL